MSCRESELGDRGDRIHADVDHPDRVITITIIIDKNSHIIYTIHIIHVFSNIVMLLG